MSQSNPYRVNTVYKTGNRFNALGPVNHYFIEAVLKILTKQFEMHTQILKNKPIKNQIEVLAYFIY